MVFGTLYYPSTYRIPFDITDGVPKMAIIEQGGFKSPLPKMARFQISGIEVTRKVSMSTLKRLAQ
jgi:hypothetical protein